MAAAITLAPCSRPAAANASDPTVQNSVPGANVVLPTQDIEVLRETLKVRCALDECSFESEYRLRNRTAHQVVARSVFLGRVDTSTLDGENVLTKRKKGDVARIHALRHQSKGPVCEVSDDSEHEKGATLAAIELRFAPHESRVLLVKGKILPGIEEEKGGVSAYGMAGPFARHPLAVAGDSLDNSACYDLWPIGTWPGRAKIKIEVELPGDAKDSSVQHKPLGYDNEDEATTIRITGDPPKARVTVGAQEAGILEVNWRRAPWNGVSKMTAGILAGYGRAGGAAAGTLQRYGVGIGFYPAFAATLAMDVIGRYRLGLLMADVMLPNLFRIFPSLYAGVGVAQRPQGVSALRTEAGLQWPIFGLQWGQDYGRFGGNDFLLTLSL